MDRAEPSHHGDETFRQVPPCAPPSVEIDAPGTCFTQNDVMSNQLAWNRTNRPHDCKSLDREEPTVPHSRRSVHFTKTERGPPHPGDRCKFMDPKKTNDASLAEMPWEVAARHEAREKKRRASLRTVGGRANPRLQERGEPLFGINRLRSL